MVLSDWFQPTGWTITSDSSDTAPLESGMAAPCLDVNSAASTRRFMYPITGAVDGKRAKGINEGTLEAWIRKGTATDANYGFFCYGKNIPSSGVSGFSGYVATINYGTSVTDGFQLIKYTSGTATTLATFNFSPTFSTQNNLLWQKLKLTWWQYTVSSLAFKIEFDDNGGAGLISVNPDSPIAAIDTQPLTATNQMTIGLYLTGADTSRKIDDVKLSASSSIPADGTPTIAISQIQNNNDDPDIPSGGFKINGTATDDLGFVHSGSYADSSVEVKVDSGSWMALTDSSINIGALTSVNATTDDDITIDWQALYTGISLGAHTAYVRVTDFGNNVSTESTLSFTVV